MISVDICEANSGLSDLLAQVEAGESVIICRNGKKIAQLLPYQEPDFDPLTTPSEARESIEIYGDPTDEVDEWNKSFSISQ